MRANWIERLEERTLLTAGQLDASFGGDGIVTTDISLPAHEYSRSVAVQKDGKIVILGQTSGGGFDLTLTRFNVDGTPDTTFGRNGKIAQDFRSESVAPYALAIDSANRLVVAARIGPDLSVIRFRGDGSLDSSFADKGKFVLSGDFGSNMPMSVAADDSVFFGASRGENQYSVNVFHLRSDGRLDLSFAENGRLQIAGTTYFEVNFLAVSRDGRLTVFADGLIARYTATGAADPTFGSNGALRGNMLPGFGVSAMAFTGDGRLWVVGRSANGYVVSRFRASGQFDRSFGARGYAQVAAPGLDYLGVRLAVGSTGTIAVLHRTSILNNNDPRTLVVQRMTPNGAIDPTFDGDGAFETTLSKEGSSNLADFGMAFQADGKLVVASQADRSILAYRFTKDGRLDGAFGPAHEGQAYLGDNGPTDEQITAVAPLPGGGVLAVGNLRTDQQLNSFDPDWQGVIARYRADGSLDTSFGRQGYVISTLFPPAYSTFDSVVASPNGKIYVSGTRQEMKSYGGLGVGGGFIARYNADGTLDRTFGDGGKVLTDEPKKLVVLQNGKLLLGTLGYQRNRRELIRLSDIGSVEKVITLDASPGTTVVKDFFQVAGGRIILISSEAGASDEYPHCAARRLNPDGTVDATFGENGIVTFTDQEIGVFATALGSDGSIYVAGVRQYASFPLGGGPTDFAVTHLRPDGRLDRSFGKDGIATVHLGDGIQMEGGGTNIPHALAVQPDGKIIVTGEALIEDYTGQAFGTARFNHDGSIDQSFGDGGVIITRVGRRSWANAMLLQGDKVLVAGVGEPGGTGDDFALLRYSLNDPTPLTARLDNRVLKVTGSAAADVIRMKVKAGSLIIPGVDHSFPLSSFSAIQIDGGGGDDVIDASGAPVPVTLIGGAGNDRLLGGRFADSLSAGAGNDTLFGGQGDDRLAGDAGNDYLSGGPGIDRLLGGDGNDQLVSLDSAADIVDGGAGFDRARWDVQDLLNSVEGSLLV